MPVQSERLASVEQRLTDHESRCEERLSEIRASAANTLAAVEGLKNRFWTLAVALAAWGLAQIWAGNEARLGHLETGPRAASHAATTYCDPPMPAVSSST